MNNLNKPLVRVTQLEQFRRYMSGDYDYVTEQSVIDAVTKEFKGNPYTYIGTAFHRIVEEGTPKCEVAEAGTRTFTYYGKLMEEAVPRGRFFDVDGFKVGLDVSQIKVAINYREQYPDAFHEIRLYKDYGRAFVTGCADMVDGVEIRDIKTKYSPINDEDYIHSVQWRYYLELFGTDVFHFDLFVFYGYKLNTHGCDVRGLPLTRYEPAITCYRYDGMEQDNLNLLNQFMDWIELRGLTEYLLNRDIENE